MLQHNVPHGEVEAHEPARDSARGAHLAHAAVVGGHLFCCGAPIALTLLATGAGASFGISAAASWFGGVHVLLHAHELWILAASAFLVFLGGALELRARRGWRFSPLFLVSVTCFLINATLIAIHWTNG
ncbi:MAG: hypothetical protein JNJ73_18490 [Hyphomonadaceae bacterium]|nr:hypothetical protein [Hyphomonadaceae bacterium]